MIPMKPHNVKTNDLIHGQHRESVYTTGFATMDKFTGGLRPGLVVGAIQEVFTNCT